MAVGTVFAAGYETSTSTPTWGTIVWWAGIEVLLFGVAYVVVWAIRTFVRDLRDMS